MIIIVIVSQLFYDGYQTAAVRLSQELQVEPPCAPSDRLLHIMLAGIENEPDRKKRTKTYGIGDSTIGPGLGKLYFKRSFIRYVPI